MIKTKLEVKTKCKRRGAHEVYLLGNYIEVKCKNGSFFMDLDDLSVYQENSWKINTSSAGYVVGTNYSKYNLLHRAVMRAKKGQNVDHINGNPLDNRKSNLRFCNQSQNLANAKKRLGVSSKYKGVSITKKTRADGSRKIYAYIQKNYKKINLGCYRCEIEAAKAYNKKAKEIFGAFARLNEIPNE